LGPAPGKWSKNGQKPTSLTTSHTQNPKPNTESFFQSKLADSPSLGFEQLFSTVVLNRHARLPSEDTNKFSGGRELLNVYQSMHLFLGLIENEGGLKQTPSTFGRRDRKKM